MSCRCACRASCRLRTVPSTARTHVLRQHGEKLPRRRSCLAQAAPLSQTVGDQGSVTCQLRSGHRSFYRWCYTEKICVSGESPSIKDLEERLNDAVRLQQYEEAAKLRDQIAEAKHDVTAAVEHCNAKFYDAFRAADTQQMESVWGQGDHVQCIHPGLPCIVGATSCQSNVDGDTSKIGIGHLHA